MMHVGINSLREQLRDSDETRRRLSEQADALDKLAQDRMAELAQLQSRDTSVPPVSVTSTLRAEAAEFQPACQQVLTSDESSDDDSVSSSVAWVRDSRDPPLTVQERIKQENERRTIRSMMLEVFSPEQTDAFFRQTDE